MQAKKLKIVALIYYIAGTIFALYFAALKLYIRDFALFSYIWLGAALVCYVLAWTKHRGKLKCTINSGNSGAASGSSGAVANGKASSNSGTATSTKAASTAPSISLRARGKTARKANVIRKIALGAALGIGGLLSYNLSLILHPFPLEVPLAKVSYIVILGGGITREGKLGLGAIGRIDRACSYLKAHSEAKVVVTGGHLAFTPCCEASVLKAALVQRGVDSATILMEENALDTIDNFRYTKRLIQDDSKLAGPLLDLPIAIVTSNFHMARSLYLAKKEGYTKAFGLGAKIPLLLVPTAYLREMLAWVKLEARMLLRIYPYRG